MRWPTPRCRTAITIHRRLLWFPVPSQALQIMPLFTGRPTIELAIRMIAGGLFPGWSVLLAPVLESLLWRSPACCC